MADGDSGTGRNGNVRRLVIVESPTKARKIAGYLGSNYIVESSRGHIRDLPRAAADVPAKYKSEPWARLGVNVDADFEPLYIISPEKKSTVAELKDLLKDVDELYLATDGDREGEAIAWHLLETLKPRIPVKRMVFHEITEPAIRAAAEDPRDLDNDLVDAQETRRILDRLYGYEVSPVLWKKVAPKLSAGRVQSVATRIIVSRERERMAFRSAGYWDVTAELDASVSDAQASPPTFTAKLNSVDGRRVATGRDFDSLGGLKKPDEVLVLDESAAGALATGLRGAQLTVSSVEQKPYTRKPYPPFMTSTLQQEAGRKLRFSSERTMSIAQRLYENGFITYMRTDSTTLSQSAINAARNQASQLYGQEYVHPQPRQYTRKVKNAQEAHEAVRPAGDRFRTPQEVQGELSRDEHALYDLIWKRTIASQMKDATGSTVSVRLGARASSGEDAEFGASGTTITFRGFLAAYEEGRDEAAAPDDQERLLPPLKEGDALDAQKLEPQGHTTTPPARYTEATLVRALEERGIGRPSTYASIIGTILDRGYAFKRGTALVPSFLAFSVVALLEQHFGKLVDYDFTARMEDDLDRIAAGDEQRVEWLKRFYFGSDGDDGLHNLVTDQLAEIDARDINSIPIGDGITLRIGRYGPYLERDDKRVSVPDDMPPDELTVEAAEALLAKPSGDVELGVDPETGRTIVARDGRYGPYVSELPPEGSDEKPRTSSLFKSMSLETVTLEDALRLLSLPRVLGEADGEEVTAQNGRYGPYVQQGKESRSLESEDQLLSITLDEARELLAKPKERRRRGAAAGPLREIGADPASEKKIVVRNGRFGPYVTDGETNASLRRGDDPQQVTLERAIELLAERRAKGPSERRKRA